MDYRNINEQIAIMLGFKKQHLSFDDENEYWIYPTKWEDEIMCIPVIDIPDFVKLINYGKDIKKMFKDGLPMQHGLNK